MSGKNCTGAGAWVFGGGKGGISPPYGEETSGKKKAPQRRFRLSKRGKPWHQALIGLLDPFRGFKREVKGGNGESLEG